MQLVQSQRSEILLLRETNSTFQHRIEMFQTDLQNHIARTSTPTQQQQYAQRPPKPHGISPLDFRDDDEWLQW